MDADFSHNPDDLVKLYNACASGEGDMAIGSRYATGVNVVNWPMAVSYTHLDVYKRQSRKYHLSRHGVNIDVFALR